MYDRNDDRFDDRSNRRRYDDSNDWNDRGSYGRRDWGDRAGDEVRSWFGDDDAERRRRMDERRYDRYDSDRTSYDSRRRHDDWW
jgi:hypothetical protein